MVQDQIGGDVSNSGSNNSALCLLDGTSYSTGSCGSVVPSGIIAVR